MGMAWSSVVRSLILIATQGFGDTFMLEKNIATQRLNFPVENFLSLPDIFIITLRNYDELSTNLIDSNSAQSIFFPRGTKSWKLEDWVVIGYFFALLSPHDTKRQ